MQNDAKSPMSKDEIKKKYRSKIWGWKIIIWGIKIFKLRVKLNWKIALIKRKTNQKNEGQTGKKNKKINWRMKLKTKKNQQKCQGKKNKKNKDQNEKKNIWEIVIERLNWQLLKTLIQ
jgi:hypothetical protein